MRKLQRCSPIMTLIFHNLNMPLQTLAKKKDQESLHALLQFYPKSRWQDKLAILESLAFSENLDALPFLLECCLNESPSLRSAAAGAIFALYK